MKIKTIPKVHTTSLQMLLKYNKIHDKKMIFNVVRKIAYGC